MCRSPAYNQSKKTLRIPVFVQAVRHFCFAVHSTGSDSSEPAACINSRYSHLSFSEINWNWNRWFTRSLAQFYIFRCKGQCSATLLYCSTRQHQYFSVPHSPAPFEISKFLVPELNWSFQPGTPFSAAGMYGSRMDKGREPAQEPWWWKRGYRIWATRTLLQNSQEHLSFIKENGNTLVWSINTLVLNS